MKMVKVVFILNKFTDKQERKILKSVPKLHMCNNVIIDVHTKYYEQRKDDKEQGYREG
jgi:hypothetical protein